MPKEFIIRGRTDSGKIEVLNFSGYKPGYAYRLVEFSLYPSTSIDATEWELMGTITAGKTAVAPTDPNFNNDGLIATTFVACNGGSAYGPFGPMTVIDDTFLITQDLLLMVQDSASQQINWQCRFVAEKMSGPAEAVANYKQFTISDGS